MTIALVAAVAQNGVIGQANALPWHLPADLQHFKRITTGHAVLMGRKTYESLGRPLPNRLNVVITKQIGYQAEGCLVAHSLDEALAQLRASASALQTKCVFVIGGGELYHAALPLADKIYLTEVQAAPEGDAFFPALNLMDWDECSRSQHPADDRHAHAFAFLELERSRL